MTTHSGCSETHKLVARSIRVRVQRIRQAAQSRHHHRGARNLSVGQVNGSSYLYSESATVANFFGRAFRCLASAFVENSKVSVMDDPSEATGAINCNFKQI
jgi:hypothetical protein